MPRVNIVNGSRRSHVCGNCKEEIPVGGSYRWIKPRYGSKKIRCMKVQCQFRPTDLSSSKAARVDEAIEDTQTALDSAESYEDIQSAMEELASVIREVGDEYQEASDNWAGGNGNEEFQEKADTCSSFADDLESWSYTGDEDDLIDDIKVDANSLIEEWPGL